MDRDFVYKKRILIIGEFCDASINSTGLYFEDMAVGLSQSANVVILSTAIGCRAKVSCEYYRKISMGSYYFPRLLRPLLITLIFAVYARFMMRNIDAVIIGTNPYWLPLITASLPHKLPIVIWCFDLFPRNLGSTNNTWRWFAQKLDVLYSKCYKRANCVIACGRDMKATLDLKYRKPASDPVIYIPNWLSSKTAISSESNGLVVKDVLRVLYFGNIGRLQAIPRLIEQIHKVKKKHVEFIFVGGGTHAHLVEEAAKLNDKIKYLGRVNMSESKKIFESSHISFISLEPGLFGTCVPSKLYFCLQNSHPIIHYVDRGSEVAQVCEEFDCGWELDFKNSKSLDSLLSNLSHEEINSKRIGAQRAAFASASLASAVKKMGDILQRL